MLKEKKVGLQVNLQLSKFKPSGRGEKYYMYKNARQTKYSQKGIMTCQAAKKCQPRTNGRRTKFRLPAPRIINKGTRSATALNISFIKQA